MPAFWILMYSWTAAGFQLSQYKPGVSYCEAVEIEMEYASEYNAAILSSQTEKWEWSKYDTYV